MILKFSKSILSAPQQQGLNYGVKANAISCMTNKTFAEMWTRIQNNIAPGAIIWATYIAPAAFTNGSIGDILEKSMGHRYIASDIIDHIPIFLKKYI